jgi:hypothetical protein
MYVYVCMCVCERCRIALVRLVASGECIGSVWSVWNVGSDHPNAAWELGNMGTSEIGEHGTYTYLW